MRDWLTELDRNLRLGYDEKIWQAAWDVFVRYDDKDFSFDCTSFAIMRQLGLINALAFDPNFEQAGFVMLPTES